MLSVLLLVLLGATVAAATALYTLLDLKSTQHYSTGNQAFGAAEAGLLDVINTINSRGIVNFRNDIVTSGIIPTTLTTVSGFPNVTYQVTTLTSGANTATDGIATITGKAPLSAERVLKVSLQRGGFLAGPGALHLSNDSAVGTFSGNSFRVDGNNWAIDTATSPPTASLDPSVPARPGISTRNDTVTDALTNGLSSGQKANVTGLGFTTSPLSPSVETTAAASTADMLRMVADIIAGLPANGPLALNQISSGNLAAPKYQWGTAAQPLVTELTNSSPKIPGNVEGYGILIVDHNIELAGTMNWYGWVLFKNPASDGIKVGGNATVYGSIWTPLPAFSGNGNITVDYCEMCLSTYADRAGNGASNGGYTPHPVTVTSWTES